MVEQDDDKYYKDRDELRADRLNKSIEDDCGVLCPEFIGILKSLYNCKLNEIPNYKELKFRLTVIILDKKSHPDLPVFKHLDKPIKLLGANFLFKNENINEIFGSFDDEAQS